MIRSEEQVKTNGIVALAIAANKLQLLVTLGEEKSRYFKVDKDVLKDWDGILKETLEFLEASEAGYAGRPSKSTRFLSRAQFIEQIYWAAPKEKRASPKVLGSYLSVMQTNIQKLAEGKTVPDSTLEGISSFAGSIADEAIKQAAKFHRTPHIRMAASV